MRKNKQMGNWKEKMLDEGEKLKWKRGKKERKKWGKQEKMRIKKRETGAERTEKEMGSR